MEDSYIIASYLRISSEDDDVKSCEKLESNSISNQRNLIKRYIETKSDLKNGKLMEFLDDGYSGTNFQRPGIQNMFQKIRENKIHCIIVKDFSRFGRNYIMVGNYLEQVFPFLGVRFISVNDSYDSKDPNCIGNLESVFKTMLADLYSKDLSQKIRSGKYTKAKKGNFINSYAPYGYKKSLAYKYQLEIDPEASNTVQWIFQEFINGKNMLEIAKILNNQLIPTPMAYKHVKGCNRDWYSISANNTNFWTPHTIYRILNDQRYIGSVVYGKRRKKEVGSKKTVLVPGNEWIILKNQHEPIISNTQFHEVQKRIDTINITKTNEKLNMFHKKLKCFFCNRQLQLQKCQNSYFFCPTTKITNYTLCSKEKLYELDLKTVVTYSLFIQILLFVSTKKISETMLYAKQEQLLTMHLKVKQDKKSLNQWKIRYQKLFTAWLDKKISLEKFKEEKKLCNHHMEEIEQEISKLLLEINILQKETEDNTISKKNRTMEQWLQDIPENKIREFIKTIYVHDDTRIQLVWNFSDSL